MTACNLFLLFPVPFVILHTLKHLYSKYFLCILYFFYIFYVKSLYIISLFICNVNLFYHEGYYEAYYAARQKQPDNQINYLNYPAIFPASFLTFTSAFV